jgi:hypothetical protein
MAKLLEKTNKDKNKEISIQVIKHCLKYYYHLNTDMYPQSSAVKTEVSINPYHGNMFCMKMDIDETIQKLPPKLKKIIIMHFIMDLPVGKICAMLGFKFRIDFYRALSSAFDAMYEHLGENWLRNI